MSEEAAPEGADQTTEDTANGDNIVTPDAFSVKYDYRGLQGFIQAVFHVEHGEVFVQLTENAPRGFGSTPEKLFRPALDQRHGPMKGYFSTSSLERDEEGHLRHSKASFRAYHVLVLDDIGSKIPEADIPEALAENYKIESSEGNFQLGYILAEPITDYDEAQLLIDLFVDAGLTDAGGAMPVKKVRLPCGVNGKPGKDQWVVRMVGELDPTPWGVQELLDAAEIDVDWEQHRLKARDRGRRVRRQGAAAWDPDLYVDTQGTTDPVMDWLYERGMVIQDGAGDPFLTIICPFRDMHTESDLANQTCGYSPLGHGMLPHRRKFFCFHSHHKDEDHTDRDYLDQIQIMGGPRDVPEVEMQFEALKHKVYLPAADKIYDISRPGQPIGIKSAIEAKMMNQVFVGTKAVNPISLWLKQRSCIKVSRVMFDASQRSRLIKDAEGEPCLNTFYLPEYPVMTPDPEVVKVFTDYLNYLIPAANEREYFIKWLAAKAQHPDFRGSAVVLTSRAQGTGKNTLMKMIERLFGMRNCQSVDMDDLLSKQSAFNEWRMRLFAYVDESLAVTDPAHMRRAYNRLKELVDPMAMPVEINQKYDVKVEAVTATSFLFFSNHTDAVYLQEGDRRFFVAAGPIKPAEPEYFGMIHDWIQTDFMPHVWNWLMDIEVDRAEMMAAPPVTDAKADMMQSTTQPITAIVKGVLAEWESAYVPVKIVNEIVRTYETRIKLPDNYQLVVRRVLEELTDSTRDKVCGMRTRVSDPSVLDDYALKQQERAAAVEAVNHHRENEHELKVQVDQWLDENGHDF